MPKKMDTNIKFTTTTTTTTTGDGPEWFYEGTTTTAIPYMWHGIYPPYYGTWGCPYLLPCGDCERTLRPCHKYNNLDKWEVTCKTNTECSDK